MVATSGDLYNRNFGGKLKLKGLKGKGLRPKRSAVDSDDASGKRNTPNNTTEVVGSGRIVSSGNTIQGFETKFVGEVAVGDTLIVKHPRTNTNEERTVESILSNRTLSVGEAFSSDLITTSVYIISGFHQACTTLSAGKQEPQDDAAANEEAAKPERKKVSTITVREKSGMWSYKNTTKVVTAQMSAEDRLNERVKHSRDKYCW
ncbi:uncharacterized protein BcabD6B2_37140 [Babesia caballi]|uniref:Uncharacterized protein n=1 Tax=Babesia caballi TaxID=5871 RepID=A0AAV4LWV9_BABCB|nr:hypothetical protein BcabD6B2_37140 [Babesia caballi]